MNDPSLWKEIPDPLAGSPPAAGSAPRVLEPAPTRDHTRRRRAAALGVSLAWLGAHLAVYGIRPDLARLPASYVAAQILLPALLGGVSLLLALAPGKLGLGLGVGILSLLSVAGPLSFWVFAVGMPPPQPPGSGPFWQGSMVCLDITLALAGVPLLLAALVLRRAFPALARWRTALVGAALGLLSGATINLHCPNVDPAHLVAGHGVPIVVAALVGALIVSRWARA